MKVKGGSSWNFLDIVGVAAILIVLGTVLHPVIASAKERSGRSMRNAMYSSIANAMYSQDQDFTLAAESVVGKLHFEDFVCTLPPSCQVIDPNAVPISVTTRSKKGWLSPPGVETGCCQFIRKEWDPSNCEFPVNGEYVSHDPDGGSKDWNFVNANQGCQ